MGKDHLDHLVKQTIGMTPEKLKSFYKSNYGCKVHFDEDRGLFTPMYHIVKTDFRVFGSLATRGTVFAIDTESGVFKGEIVCVPFFKFFNHGESLAHKGSDDDIVVVQEKRDGSLIKFFHHRGEWVVATNGTSSADQKFVALFEKAAGRTRGELGASLDQQKVYIFELCSPENQIVVPQTEYSLTLLLVRCRNTWDELPIHGDGMEGVYEIVKPMKFDPSQTGVEGVVVVYKGGHRVKRKTQWYLDLHKMPTNGARVERLVSDKWRVLNAVVGGYIDDYWDKLTNDMKVFVAKAKHKLRYFEVLQDLKLKHIDPTFSLDKVDDKKTRLVPLLGTGVFESAFPEKCIRVEILNVLFGKSETINYKKILKKLFKK
jgi:hypothetical protein